MKKVTGSSLINQAHYAFSVVLVIFVNCLRQDHRPEREQTLETITNIMVWQNVNSRIYTTNVWTGICKDVGTEIFLRQRCLIITFCKPLHYHKGQKKKKDWKKYFEGNEAWLNRSRQIFLLTWSEEKGTQTRESSMVSVSQVIDSPVILPLRIFNNNKEGRYYFQVAEKGGANFFSFLWETIRKGFWCRK